MSRKSRLEDELAQLQEPKPKLKTRKNNYRPILYDEIKEMALNGRNLCGYIRIPITNDKDIYGKCALDDNRCHYKENSTEECKKYQNRFTNGLLGRNK